MKYTYIIYRIIAMLAAILSVALVTDSCTSKLEEGDLGSFPYLNLVEGNQFEIGKDGGDLTIQIQANREVDVLPSAAWAKENTTSTNENEIVLTVDPNIEEESRECTITLSISEGTITQTVTIIQDESGIRTYTGDLFIGTEAELEAAKDYTRVDGNLIIGQTIDNTKSEDESTDGTTMVNIDGTEYYFGSCSINSISELTDSLTEITRNIYVINSEISDLSCITKYNDVKKLVSIGNHNLESLEFLGQTNLDSLVVRGSSSAVEEGKEYILQKGLTYLDIASNNLVDISFLSKATTLTDLVLGQGVNETNNIFDLTHIYGLTGLLFLDISGLPVSLSEIEALRAVLPDCEIIADDMRGGTPTLDITFSSVTTNGMTLNAIISDEGYDEITEKGFLFGTDPNDLTEYPIETEEFTMSLSGKLSSGNLYYAKAYAKNTAGTGYSYLQSQYTDGAPKVESDLEIELPDNNTISVSTSILFAGNSDFTYGVLLGSSSDLDTTTSKYIEKKKETIKNEQIPDYPIEVNETFSNVNSGTRYYVRSYVYNKHGIAYSDAQEVVTGGEPSQNKYKLTVTPTYPAYSNLTTGESSTSYIYATYFRNDISGSGSWIESISSDNSFTFNLYAGVQNLVFTNAGTNSGHNLNCETSVSDDILVQYTADGNEGLGAQLVAGSLIGKEINQSVENSPVSLTMQRLSSKMALSMTYIDTDGSTVQNLAEQISKINITMDGLASQVVLGRDMSWRYVGSAQYTKEITEISTGNSQTIGDLHFLPSGNPLNFNVTITFVDGTSVELKTNYSAPRANTNNNITIRLAKFNNETGSGFTLETIEEIDEEIEFK